MGPKNTKLENFSFLYKKHTNSCKVMCKWKKLISEIAFRVLLCVVCIHQTCNTCANKTGD
jgi:hypothetical protein